MASSNAPKHDFAPAWLKIPNQENPKSSGLKPSDQTDKATRGRKDDAYHNSYNRCGPDYNRLQRQHSFDNYYDGKRHPSKFRHHSVEEDYYTCQYGPYPYYNGYNSYDGYDKYNMQYNSQPSLLRPPSRDTKYQPQGSRFAQLNGAYPSYYDLYPYDYYHGDAYYSGYPGRTGSKRSYHDKEGRAPREGRDRDKSKERESGAEKHKLFNDDFPSLNGEKKEHVTNKVVNGGGVWDNPPLKSSSSNKPEESHSESAPKESPAKSSPSSANIYKALVPNKGNLPRKTTRLNGAYSKEPGAYTGSKVSPQAASSKEGTRQSPTPAIDILSTRLVTQPKNLGDKKSNFLRALRRETNSKGEETEKSKSDDKTEPLPASDGVEVEQTEELTNGMDSLSVEEHSKDVLSSSLEAEQRLLREMGWDEADQEDYEITEDDMKEFQNLSKQVKQQRNGLVKTLPVPWSPSHMAAVYQATPPDLNETLSSSDSDEL